MNACVWVVRALFEMYRTRTPQIRHPALQRMLQVRYGLWTAVLIGTLFMLFAQLASAAPNFDLFDPIVDGVVGTEEEEGTTEKWFDLIRGMLRTTFVLLGAIEIAWAAAIWMIEKDNLSSLAVEMAKKFMAIGFFGLLLQFAPDWIPEIFKTFETMGTTVTAATGGTPKELSTDGIISEGLDVIEALWKDAVSQALINIIIPFGIWDSVARIAATSLTSLIVAIAFAIAAAQYFALKIEAGVLFAAGAIFLGFGSNSFTREYTQKYINHTISVGLRLLVLILILSITLKAVGEMGRNYGTFNFKPLFGVMAGAVLQAILAMKVPEMAGALLQGGVGLSGGSVGSAVASTAGNVVGVGAVMGNVAKGVASLTQAAGAATKARAGGLMGKAAQSGSGAIGGLSSAAALPTAARAMGNAAGHGLEKSPVSSGHHGVSGKVAENGAVQMNAPSSAQAASSSQGSAQGASPNSGAGSPGGSTANNAADAATASENSSKAPDLGDSASTLNADDTQSVSGSSTDSLTLVGSLESRPASISSVSSSGRSLPPRPSPRPPRQVLDAQRATATAKTNPSNAPKSSSEP